MSIEILARAQADIDIASEQLAEAYGLHVALAFQERLAVTLRLLERNPLSAGAVDPPYSKHPEMRVQTVVKFKSRLVFSCRPPPAFASCASYMLLGT